MKIALICEYSGRVRQAFADLGHDAVSFDILPTELPGNHVQGDINDLADDYWKQFDMAICFPPCTYLSFAGNKYLKSPGRLEKREEAFRFFMKCIQLPIEKICVENPTGYPNSAYRKPNQIIHPYYFGENEMKRTCLWLKGLPLLTYEKPAEKPRPYKVGGNGKNVYFTEAMKNDKDRAKNRNKTFMSIALAMASQWGGGEKIEQNKDI